MKVLDLIRSWFSKSAPVKPPVIVEKPKLLLDPIISTSDRIRSWQGIVLHHSATVDGKTNDWDAIRRYHTSYRIDGNIVTAAVFKQRQAAKQGQHFEEPWTEIGYHLGLEMVNEELKICRGRSLLFDGAHAQGFNKTHIGICLVGNYDVAPPTSDQLQLLATICIELQAIYKIPKEKVIGHRETYLLLGKPVGKTCPGSKFALDGFRSRLTSTI